MPHMLRAFLVSSRGSTAMPSPVLDTLISSGSVKASSPLGPFTLTIWPSTTACTLAGTGTGRLPVRDMALVPLSATAGSPQSEHVAQDLAAHLLLARPRIGHHA